MSISSNAYRVSGAIQLFCLPVEQSQPNKGFLQCLYWKDRLVIFLAFTGQMNNRWYDLSQVADDLLAQHAIAFRLGREARDLAPSRWIDYLDEELPGVKRVEPEGRPPFIRPPKEETS